MTRQEMEAKYKKRLDGLFSGIEPGLAIVFGSCHPKGAELDTTKMIAAFDKIGFAVFNAGIDIMTRENLLALIYAAASFTPITGKVEVIALYFAGHGGSDNNEPYINLVGKDWIYIADLLSPFTRRSTEAKRIFFFDVCCRRDAGTKSVFYLPSSVNSLVAIATETESAGDHREGGYWTRYLSKNITEDMDIFGMLALTRKETINCTGNVVGRYHSGVIQEPCFTACIENFNLKSLRKDHQHTQQHDTPSQIAVVKHTAGPSVSSASRQSERIETDSVGGILGSSAPDDLLGEDDLIDIMDAVGDFIKWHDLGLRLGLKDNTLDVIVEEKGKNVSSCIRAMFRAWLRWQDNVQDQQYGLPSWRRLIKAIAKLDKNLATKIQTSAPWQ